MGTSGEGRNQRRSVSLYWREKVWLILDGLQLLAILLSALQSSLPYGWNVWARYSSVVLLDITGLMRPLATTNKFGLFPLDATQRAFVMLLLLILVLAAASAWPKAIYALELYERRQELEKIMKEQELQRLRRPSQARPSVTAMLAVSLRPTAPSFFSRCRTLTVKLWSGLVVIFYTLLGKATRLRAALALFLLPAFLAMELPLIFCSDQADMCTSIGLLFVRVASFGGVVGLVFHSVLALLRDVREASVARQNRQEEYLKQREIEYLLFINNDWLENKIWLVSSFKGGVFSSYFRLWLLLLKAALIVSSSLLGQASSRLPTGLGWLTGLGRTRDLAAAAAAAAQAANGTLGEAIAAEPLGEGARTAAAASLVLIFCVFALFRPPFRCRSSNCMHLILFIHLAGVSGIGLAAAGADAKRNSFLLYSNQHLLLEVVHLCTLGLLLATAGWCCLRCLMPTESPLLQRYEVMMGYTASGTSRGGADGRGTVASLCRNLHLLAHRCWRRCASRCHNSSSSSYGSWSSGTTSTLELGETQIRETDYNLEPFEAPWPTRPQHARFWLRVAPELVERLATSSLLVQRYAAAQKQLLPVHVANAVFRELEALVVQHIGAVEQIDMRRRSRKQSRKKPIEEEKQILEQLIQELGMGRTAAAVAAAKPEAQEPSGLIDEWDKTQQGEPHEKTPDAGVHEEGFVFKQQRQETTETLWSVDSAAAACADAAAAIPHALAFKQLERAAHLSATFPGANLTELQDLNTLIKAVEWTVTEVFGKMSAIRAAAAAESIWRDGAPPLRETQKLLHDFAIHLTRRQRQMVLLQPVRRRVLLRLLALRFITDTKRQREKREKEKKIHMADLFGEESSIMFFDPHN